MSDDLTLEKLEISKRLSQVETNLATMSTKLDVHAVQILALVQRHEELLHGSNGNKGIVTRLDRVEQFKSGMEKHLLGLWTAVVGGVVKLVVDVFRR